MGRPVVSVIIPTYNRVSSLQRVLEGFTQQKCDDPFEVVVVSDGSTDETDEFLRSLPTPIDIVALRQDNAGPAAARNRGIEAARGELIVFVDDDTVPDQLLVASHLGRHERPGDDLVVTGPMCTPDDHMMTPWIAWEQRTLSKHYQTMLNGDLTPSARQFYTGNASVARCHLVAAGGFDTTFRRSEDVELAYRLSDRGLRFAFEPAARVDHYAERTLPAWLDVAYSYGRNDVILSRDGGRAWLIGAIGAEFRDRHPLVRAATRMSLPRPRLGEAITGALVRAAGKRRTRHLGRLRRVSLSGAYNLRYYRGMADEIGGFDRLMSAFEKSSIAP